MKHAKAGVNTDPIICNKMIQNAIYWYKLSWILQGWCWRQTSDNLMVKNYQFEMSGQPVRVCEATCCPWFTEQHLPCISMPSDFNEERNLTSYKNRSSNERHISVDRTSNLHFLEFTGRTDQHQAISWKLPTHPVNSCFLHKHSWDATKPCPFFWIKSKRFVDLSEPQRYVTGGVNAHKRATLVEQIWSQRANREPY